GQAARRGEQGDGVLGGVAGEGRRQLAEQPRDVPAAGDVGGGAPGGQEHHAGAVRGRERDRRGGHAAHRRIEGDAPVHGEAELAGRALQRGGAVGGEPQVRLEHPAADAVAAGEAQDGQVVAAVAEGDGEVRLAVHVDVEGAVEQGGGSLRQRGERIGRRRAAIGRGTAGGHVTNPPSTG